ncbi:hypothetical protein J2X36_005072 [Methylobacterium sp. BE186]|nr:hypothetical protein [Methylobacterium sp. BE186]
MPTGQRPAADRADREPETEGWRDAPVWGERHLVPGHLGQGRRRGNRPRTGSQGWFLRLVTPRFHRPVGTAPAVGSERTTWRINETIDGSVFARWRDNPGYRPPNLAEWIERMRVDPTRVTGALKAEDATPV